MNQKMRDLIGEWALPGYGRWHHPVTGEPLHVADQNAADGQSAQHIQNLNAFRQRDWTDLALRHNSPSCLRYALILLNGHPLRSPARGHSVRLAFTVNGRCD